MPPYAVIGPAIEVALPKVRLAVLVDLPTVNPLNVFGTVKFVIGKVSALAKLDPKGSTTREPVV